MEGGRNTKSQLIEINRFKKEEGRQLLGEAGGVWEIRMPANVTVSSKISQAEKDALDSISKAIGLSLSTLIRFAIRRIIMEYYRKCGSKININSSLISILERVVNEENPCKGLD